MSTLDDFKASTLQAAQANVLAAAVAQVAALNDGLKANFQQAFGSWLTNWNAGRVTDSTTAPKPPNAFVVAYAADPTTGPGSVGPYGETQIFWAYPGVGKVPVCDMPAIPAIPSNQSIPNHIHVGHALGGGWFSAGQDDTLPSGQATPPVTTDDGVTGTFVKYGAPVGAGWYLLKP